MNTPQLHQALSHLEPAVRTKFLGVFALNKLPTLNQLKQDRCLIFNTDPDYLPGTHWCAIYLHVHPSGYVTGELFDSLAARTPPPEIYKFMNRHCQAWTVNPFRLQGKSQVCSQYCLVYLIGKCKGYTTEEIFQDFSRNDYVTNDFKVFQMICKRFPEIC